MSKTQQSGTPQFSKWRAMLWPVYAYELKKVLPMGGIFFCILFNYTALRNTKDALIVTAAGSGAEALVILKTFFVTPAALAFVVLYTKMSNVFNREHLFYVTITPFIAFFALFGFYLYPNRELLHPTLETVHSLQAAYPHFKWFFSVYGVWTYSLFYILAELWGSLFISLAFWQFANQITRMSESKRFYALFSLLGQFSLIASGSAVDYFSTIQEGLPEGADPWGITLKYLMTIVVVFGFICMGIYRWINTSVLTDPRFYDPSESRGGGRKAKLKMGLWDSFKMIFTSPYLGLIAMLIIAYGSSINLVEGVWKSQIKLLYKDPNSFNSFMGVFSTYTGIATMVMTIIGGNILRMFRWLVGAMITPVFIMIGGVLFYVMIIFRHTLAPLLEGSLHLSPLQLTVFFGALIVVGSKAVKYALFDLTKEMAYIPLDEEMKVKGKAVVDAVGGRLGKATGAGYQSALLIVTGSTLIELLPFLSSAFVVLCSLWIMSVKLLSKRVETAVASTHA